MGFKVNVYLGIEFVKILYKYYYSFRITLDRKTTETLYCSYKLRLTVLSMCNEVV